MCAMMLHWTSGRRGFDGVRPPNRLPTALQSPSEPSADEADDQAPAVRRSAASYSYGERAGLARCTTAQRVLRIMAEKQSNLCVSVDLTDSAAALRIIDTVGPFVCCVKTHVDIMDDFSCEFVDELLQVSAFLRPLVMTSSLQWTLTCLAACSWAPSTSFSSLRIANLPTWATLLRSKCVLPVVCAMCADAAPTVPRRSVSHFQLD
jgi:hypothetical protein